jgi:hypothetical protein
MAMTKLQRQFVVDSTGKKTAVILPVKQYEQLLEDMHDLAVVAERRQEEPVEWKKVKRRLQDDGLI